MLLNLLTSGGSSTTEPQATPWATYVIMGVIVLAIIGLFVWQSFANKKKRKEAQDMMSSLQPGVKIKTIGGICGYLVEMNDAENTFILQTGTEENKCYIKFDKGAIYQTGAAVDATSANAAPAKKEEVKVEEKKIEEVAEVFEEIKPEEAKEEVKTEEVAEVKEETKDAE